MNYFFDGDMSVQIHDLAYVCATYPKVARLLYQIKRRGIRMTCTQFLQRAHTLVDQRDDPLLRGYHRGVTSHYLTIYHCKLAKEIVK